MSKERCALVELQFTYGFCHTKQTWLQKNKMETDEKPLIPLEIF